MILQCCNCCEIVLNSGIGQHQNICKILQLSQQIRLWSVAWWFFLISRSPSPKDIILSFYLSKRKLTAQSHTYICTVVQSALLLRNIAGVYQISTNRANVTYHTVLHTLLSLGMLLSDAI